jgi:hypothetical protein
VDGDTGLDPERFVGLADAFFWKESMTVDRPKPWVEEYAHEVGRQRSEGKTHEQLATQFGVTLPTIRKALRIAAKADTSLEGLPRKMARARWQDSHYTEVQVLIKEGWSVKKMADHFKVSEPLIRAALAIVADSPTPTAGRAGTPPPKSDH